MKYKDNNFSKFQDRQRDGEVGYYSSSKSDRQVRREQEHRLSLFYSKYLSKKVEKDWWLCLSFDDKQRLETSYYNQEQMMEEKDRMSMWSNFEFFDTWKEWFEHIADEYKPDRIKYRESKLKKLGI
jgi:hypothetical protein